MLRQTLRRCFVAVLLLALSAPQAALPQQDPNVYITRTGKKYHRGSCGSLSRSKIEIGLSKAKASGYTACQVCKPAR